MYVYGGKLRRKSPIIGALFTKVIRHSRVRQNCKNDLIDLHTEIHIYIIDNRENIPELIV